MKLQMAAWMKRARVPAQPPRILSPPPFGLPLPTTRPSHRCRRSRASVPGSHGPSEDIVNHQMVTFRLRSPRRPKPSPCGGALPVRSGETTQRIPTTCTIRGGCCSGPSAVGSEVASDFPEIDFPSMARVWLRKPTTKVSSKRRVRAPASGTPMRHFCTILRQKCATCLRF